MRPTAGLQSDKRSNTGGCTRGPSGQIEPVVKCEGFDDFGGLPGLALGQIGGFLPAHVVFALGLALLAGRFIAGFVGGARLKIKFALELGDDRVADGGLLHSG